METTDKLAKLGLFDAKVPRYTSYPTAPQFGGGVEGSKFRDWIRAVPVNGQISLYIHVPFCRRLCWFCACRTQGTLSGKPVAAYLDTLLQELELLKQSLPDGVTLSRMHWGGGTPTLLEPDMMKRLAEAVFAVLPLGQGAEFSVEIDPNEVDQARVDALAAVGMTRASIGVQDFDADIQTTIGRIQSFETTREAAEMLRAAGVSSLNADILFVEPYLAIRRETELQHACIDGQLLLVGLAVMVCSNVLLPRSEQSVILDIHQVARVKISCVLTSLDEDSRFTCVWNIDRDRGIGPTDSRFDSGEEPCVRAWECAWPVGVGSEVFRRGHELGRSTVLGDPQHSDAAATEEDRAVFTPVGAPHDLRITQRDDRPAAGADLLQRRPVVKTDPLAVGREERPVRALRTGQ